MNTLKIFIFRSVTVRALSSAIVAILLVCVTSRVSSTRYATHEPKNGAIPQASPLPFDLVPQGEDPNGLPLNPKWGAQVYPSPGSFPNPQYTAENPICPDKDFRGPLCSSPGQVSGIDGPEANYGICFWGPSGPHRVKGHVNWVVS